MTATFRRYELPDGRTPESFQYRIEELDFEACTDTLYTDDLEEVQRIVPALLNDGYNIRVVQGDSDR